MRNTVPLPDKISHRQLTSNIRGIRAISVMRQGCPRETLVHRVSGGLTRRLVNDLDSPYKETGQFLQPEGTTFTSSEDLFK